MEQERCGQWPVLGCGMDSPANDITLAEPQAVTTANRTTILLYCSLIMVALNFVSPAVGFHVIPLSFVLKNKLHLSANALATFVLWAGIPAYFSFAFGVVRDFWSPFGIGDRGYYILVGFHVIPLSFVLKNKLHLSANALATFVLWAGIPAYFSFAFGVVRDFWSPFGIGDRGYYILFGLTSALVFAVFAFVPVSEPMLLALALLGTISFLFLWAGWNGLGTVIGQHFAMSGRISSLWNFSGTVTTFVALLLGGILSDRLETMSTEGAVR